MSKNISPPSTSKPPRVSVPVSAEVLAIFERLAKAGNMSTGRAMAEWLADTVEAAELMASTMERARAAPKIVTAEIHAMMLGMAEQTKEMSDKFRKYKGTLDDYTAAEEAAKLSTAPPAAKRSRSGSELGASIPPSCNTGGKLPNTEKTKKPLKPGFPLPPARVQAHADTNGVPPKGKK